MQQNATNERPRTWLEGTIRIIATSAVTTMPVSSQPTAPDQPSRGLATAASAYAAASTSSSVTSSPMGAGLVRRYGQYARNGFRKEPLARVMRQKERATSLLE